jgi:hypothetical protein
MSMDYIRKAYGVIAKRGMRIEYTGAGRVERGVITGSRGHLLRIKLDGHRRSMPFHPTWEIRYLWEEGPC